MERRAPSPLLPIPLLKNPSIWRADALAACHGGTIVSLLTFLPIYLRMSHGASPGTTGLLLLPFTVGIGIGALLTGRIVSRTGRTAIFPSCGMAVVAASLIVLAFSVAGMSPTEIGWAFGFVALFMGTVMGVVQLTVQVTSGARELGAGSATVQFSRSLGAATGTALVGTVLFTTLTLRSPEAGQAFGLLLQSGPAGLQSLTAAQQGAIMGGLEDAFRNAFLCIACFVLFALYLAWSLPLRRI